MTHADVRCELLAIAERYEELAEAIQRPRGRLIEAREAQRRLTQRPRKPS